MRARPRDNKAIGGNKNTGTDPPAARTTHLSTSDAAALFKGAAASVRLAPACPVSAARIAAVLWDLDGTLVDSEPHHAALEARVLREHGVDPASLDPSWAVGRTTRSVFAAALAQVGRGTAVEAAMARRAELAEEMLIANVAPLPSARRVLDEVAASRRMALVTSTDRAVVTLLLARLSWTARFEVVITSDDVDAPKPSAEPYALAAERLGLAPAHCLAVEDSLTGVAAAVAAGVRVAAVTTSFSADQLSAADWVLSGVAEVPELLAQLDPG